MSEEQQEQEVVSGVIEGVTQKKPDTWQVVVKPAGSQYTKKLWTKDAELVTALTAKLGMQGAFVCNASYWTTQSGAQVRSLWINSLSDGIPGEAISVGGSVRASGNALPHTETQTVDWDAKERRDYRSRAWAQTISALTHTIKTDEPAGEVFRRLHALQRMIYRDIVRDFDSEAFADDDVPF